MTSDGSAPDSLRSDTDAAALVGSFLNGAVVTGVGLVFLLAR